MGVLFSKLISTIHAKKHLCWIFIKSLAEVICGSPIGQINTTQQGTTLVNIHTITKTGSYQQHSIKGNTLLLRHEEPFLHNDALPTVDNSLHYIVLLFMV